MAPKVGEEEARFWDIWVKIIGGFVAIATLIVGCNTLSRQGDQLKAQQEQYEATRNEQVKAMEEEYHRRFWEKKLDVYMRLCHAASSLALAQPKSDEYKQANHELMLIYGGEFQVVASPEVKKAFGEFLSTVLSTPSSEAIKDLPQVDWGKLSAVSPTPSSEGKTPSSKGKIEVAHVDWAKFFAYDLHERLTALALACRQDSGSEFHLSDQQVEKFNKATTDITTIIQEVESKIEQGK